MKVELELITRTSGAGMVDDVLIKSTNENKQEFAIEVGKKVYFTSYNIISGEDKYGNKHTEAIEIVEIKENSVIFKIIDVFYKTFVDCKEIKTNKKFEVSTGSTIFMDTLSKDVSSNYIINVKKIINK